MNDINEMKARLKQLAEEIRKEHKTCVSVLLNDGYTLQVKPQRKRGFTIAVRRGQKGFTRSNNELWFHSSPEACKHFGLYGYRKAGIKAIDALKNAGFIVRNLSNQEKGE